MDHKKIFTDTDNHVFSLDDLIGRGAQGNIYKGVHKVRTALSYPTPTTLKVGRHAIFGLVAILTVFSRSIEITGEVHALKMFDKYNIQTQREMDALSKLQHPNIVKFYKCEKDNKNKDIIVMELCEGGSLLDMIRKPQNITGIDEEEFLRIFSHLVSGIKHLRKHGFSHRDIKPGNILVCVGEDGRNIYKLSDFGTAKPLNDNDFFVSLVGTDEYLHPDIYKAAFIDRRRGGGTFTIAADLWSLGATLYHTVTGKVPFNPYTGREDKNVMYEMISQKESGVIAGEQESPGGSIHWSKNLPNTCRLSRAFAICLKTILVNLLECDSRKIWSFEDFFDAADELLSRKPVLWFCTRTCSYHTSYLKPKTSLTDFQKEVSTETSIPQTSQCILYSGSDINSYLSDKHPTSVPVTTGSTDKQPISDLVTTDSNNPLIVMDETTSGTSCCVSYESWEQIVFKEALPVFELSERTVYDVMRDSQVAKLLCAKMFLMEKIVRKLELSKDLLRQAVYICRKLHKDRLKALSREIQFLQQRLNDITALTEHTKKERFTAITKEGDEAEDDVIMAKKRVALCIKTLKELSEQTSLDNGFDQLACSGCHNNRTDNERKVRKHLEQSEDLLKKFMERRGQRMTVHIEYMHNFDRKNIQGHCKDVQNILNSCKSELSKDHSEFQQWNRLYITEKGKVDNLENFLKDASSSIDDLVQTLKEVNSQEPQVPAIGQKTLKRRQFVVDMNLRVEDLQKDIVESKLLAVQSREQLDSMSSLMSDLPDLYDVDFQSLTSPSEPPLTNGIDPSSLIDMSLEEDFVKFKT